MTPFTNLYPKPMAPYNNSTLLNHVLSRIKDRVKYVHITAGYKKTILSNYAAGLKVSSIFYTEGKGNCWWIYNTLLNRLDEPVYVFTCDNIIDIDYDLLEADYFELGAPANLIIPVNLSTNNYAGDYVVHQDKFINRICPDIKTNILCSRMQIINPSRGCLRSAFSVTYF